MLRLAAWILLGWSLLPAGMPAAAMAPSPLDRGRLLIAQKKYPQAQAVLLQAAKFDPNNSDVYKSLGDSYWYPGYKAQAIAAYKRAVQLDPSKAALKNWMIQQGFYSATGTTATAAVAQPAAGAAEAGGARRAKKKMERPVGFGFDVTAGYAYLNMEGFNTDFRNLAGPGVTETDLHHALRLGLDLNLTLFDSIVGIGPRVQYFYALPGQLNQGGTNTTSGFDGYAGVQLIPILFGIQVKMPTTVALQAGFNAGLGLAKWQFWGASSGGGFPSATFNASASGSVPMYEGRLGLRFGKLFHGLIDFGYRQALMSQINVDSQSNMGGMATVGKPLAWNAKNTPTPLDFGGFDLSFKFGYDF